MKQDLERYGLIPKLPLVFDNAFVGTFGECERMAFYQTILGRRPVNEDAYALLYGTVFHRIAESWVNDRDIMAVTEIIEANIPPDIDDHYGRTQGRMQEAFLEWAKFREKDPITIIRTEQSVAVDCREGPCPYSESGCGFQYGGRIDQIVEWNNMIGPLDIKTTTNSNDDPASEYRPSHQMQGYVWATSHLIGRLCWGAIVERLVINKGKIAIARFPVSYDKHLMAEWIENERLLHTDIKSKYALYSHDETQWRQNLARCCAPQRRCRFREACLTPAAGDLRLRWLRDNTSEQRFDFQAVEANTNAV